MKDNFTELIRNEVSLYSYISRFINLKKRGNSFVGLCPFHNEKTPSFTVSVEKNLYHCFGCKASGDIFKFVMDYERVSFSDAQVILSEYSNIALSKSKVQDSKYELYFSINKKFLDFFHERLFSTDGKKALSYLKDRGLTEEVIKEFHLGFSPNNFNYHLYNLRLSKDEINASFSLGLIKQNKERKDEFYTFFRNRIIFPIRDFKNKPIAFSGRILEDQEGQAKYVNSETSSIFDKKKVLFNLNYAKPYIIKQNSVLIVEGYMDVIGLYIKGIKNVVACMGTSLSSYHFRYLKNLTSKAVLIFDSDEAGQKAALSACKLAYLENFIVEVLILKKGEDPFDLSTKFDEKQLIDFIYSKDLISSSNFIMQNLLNKTTQNSTPEEKKDALESVYSFLNELKKQSDKEMFIQLCSNQIGISYNTLLLEFTESKKNRKQVLPKDISPSRAKTSLVECERRIISLVIKYPFLFSLNEDITQVEFSDSYSAFLWEFIYTKYLNEEKIDYLDFFSSYPLPDNIKKVFSEYFINDNLMSNNTKEDFLIINTFKTLIYRQKEFLIDMKIKSIGNNNSENFHLLSKYKLEKNEISNKIKLLSSETLKGE